MSILEEFWYGNLDPAEYDACPSKDYAGGYEKRETQRKMMKAYLSYCQ